MSACFSQHYYDYIDGTKEKWLIDFKRKDAFVEIRIICIFCFYIDYFNILNELFEQHNAAYYIILWF